MKVICPKCQKNIADKYTNKSKGLAYCQYCKDYFLLDNHLKRNSYLIRREEKFLKTPKPPKSKIELKKTNNEFAIVIPNRLPLEVRIFLIIFLCAFGYAIYQILANTLEYHLETYLKIGGIILLQILIILALILKASKTLLSINKERVQITRKRYILPLYSRKRKTNNLDKINTYFISDNESGSSSGIEITFHNENNLRFGHNLRFEEQNWLTGQLILIRDTMTLDEKVTKEIEIKLSRSRNNPLVVTTSEPPRSSPHFSDQLKEDSLIVSKDNNTWNAFSILILYLIGMLIFGTVAIGFWGFLPPFEHHKIMKYVFSIFTLLASYGLFYYLYTFIYRAEQQVSISPEEIKIELQPFGIPLTKVRPTKALTEITRSREWKCVILKFDGYQDLRIGFSLSNEEIKYLIGKLKRLTQVMNNQNLLVK